VGTTTTGLVGVGVGVGVGIGVGVGEGVGVGVGEGVGLGLGLKLIFGVGVNVGVGAVVGSWVNGGRVTAKVGGAVSSTATPPCVGLAVGRSTMALPLNMPDRTTSTDTASRPTAMNASQSRRALDRLGRTNGTRETTPVRRSEPVDRGSGLAMGSAGYSRTDNWAGQPPRVCTAV
jgi:hypothetical protein